MFVVRHAAERSEAVPQAREAAPLLFTVLFGRIHASELRTLLQKR